MKKKIKEQEVQAAEQPEELPEEEQAVEEPKEVEEPMEAEEPAEVEEASEPVAEETEPAKEKKGMPRFLKFVIFELITIIIALGAHYALLQFVAPILDLDEMIEWAIMTGAAFVLYLIAGYLFNHLIVYKGKGKATFPKFLLSALIGWALCLALIHLGVFILKIVVPATALNYNLVSLSINAVLALGGESLPMGLGILGGAIILTMVYSLLIRNLFVFKDKKVVEKVEEETEPEEEEAEEKTEEETKEEVKEEAKPEAEKTQEEKAKEPKEDNIVTHASFRKIVKEELDKFFTPKKKYVRQSQIQSYIDQEIDAYEKKYGKKKGE